MMGTFDDDHDRRLTWRCRKRAGVAAILAGSAAVVMATVGGAGMQLASSPTAVADEGWAATSAPTYTDLQNAAQNLANAVNAGNRAGIQPACQELNGAAQRAGATLPSPDPALTSEVQAAVDEIITTTNACVSFDPQSQQLQQADVDKAESQLKQAEAHLRKAQQIVQGMPGG
jgi:hypothetical protein